MPLLTGNQLRAARALAELSQSELAEQAHVNINTIRNMERRRDAMLVSGMTTVRKVELVLAGHGVTMVGETPDALGVSISPVGQPLAA